MINVGIIGATGYTGEELINILIRHAKVRITHLEAKIDKAIPIAGIFPRFRNRIEIDCVTPNIDLAISHCDLLFLAVPHTVSMNIVPKLLSANKRVIDLSADYRLRDTKIYKTFYKKDHSDVKDIKIAVYGLPEIYRAKIKGARLIANPGCYPTAAILALAPLFSCKDIESEILIIDAKTGVTGAGRRALLEYSFSEINEDVYAYKTNIHQHIPEIEQELSNLAGSSIKTIFVPHLFPINRGIFQTIYVKYNQESRTTTKQLIDLYKRFYKKEPFVRVKGDKESVRLKDVVGTNFCDIAISVFEEEQLIIITTVIDNLKKGAAGQAVQNMNIMCGFPETESLI